MHGAPLKTGKEVVGPFIIGRSQRRHILQSLTVESCCANCGHLFYGKGGDGFVVSKIKASRSKGVVLLPNNRFVRQL